MKHERAAVAAAVSQAPNLNVAAARLGASRRTLQNRMREYGMGYGTPGRRKVELPKAKAAPLNAVEWSVVGGALALLAGGALGILWLRRQEAQAREAERKSGASRVSGFDMLGAD